MNRFGLEFKIMIYVIVFSLLLIGFQPYYLFTTTQKVFANSKQSKNALLIDTVTPVVTLNMSLGLTAANKEYLDKITSKNSDIKHLEIRGTDNKTIYTFTRFPATLDPSKRNRLNFCSRKITDPYSHKLLGVIAIDFFENDLHKMQQSYFNTALLTLGVSLLAIILFLLLLKHEFRRLKKLSEAVLSYNPATRTFPVESSTINDEVGIIQNAIIKMVHKLNFYANELDEQNKRLEEKVRSRTRALEIANERLEALSTTDALTSLPNRRHFEQQYTQMWELSKRNRAKLSVVICDIDHFKQINDTYGHLVGDIVLKKIAELLRGTSKRSTDYIARIGGEEFALLLPDSDEKHASEFCEKIRQRMQQMRIVVDQTTTLEGITFSFGICTVVPKEKFPSKDAMKYADNALYEAKERGRDRAVVCTPPDKDV